MDYPPVTYPVSCGRASVEVTVDDLLQGLCLFIGRVAPESTVDTALVALSPGGTAAFRVTGAVPGVGSLTRPPVLRCVNDIDLRGLVA